MLRAPSAAIVAAIIAAGATGSCMNPVQTDRIDALGPEANGERPGPTHRPGQPCRVCHSADGPGPEFTFAGTIYATRAGTSAASGVAVVLTSINGKTYTTTTNRVGNFYVSKREFDPPFPVRVKLVSGGTTKEMETRMNLEGGCAFCHRDVTAPWGPAGSDAADVTHQMPHVFVREP